MIDYYLSQTFGSSLTLVGTRGTARARDQAFILHFTSRESDFQPMDALMLTHKPSRTVRDVPDLHVE